MAHDAGIRTFVSIEPWISDVTHPQSIIEKLRDSVDRFIVGSMQYCDVPRSFYTRHLPALISRLKENKIDYYLKKELRSCLTGLQETSANHIQTGNLREHSNLNEPYFQRSL